MGIAARRRVGPDGQKTTIVSNAAASECEVGRHDNTALVTLLVVSCRAGHNSHAVCVGHLNWLVSVGKAESGVLFECPRIERVMTTLEGEKPCRCHPNGMAWAGCPVHGGSAE